MYSNILVPLDGSSFAETALPHAVALAEKFNCTLTLVNVFETPPVYQKALEQGVIDDIHAAAVQQANAYLEEQKGRLSAENLTIVTGYVEGHNVASMLLEAIAESGADLVVMSTHGANDLLRWRFGSVAQRVARHSPVPIVLVQPKNEI